MMRHPEKEVYVGTVVVSTDPRSHLREGEAYTVTEVSSGKVRLTRVNCFSITITLEEFKLYTKEKRQRRA